MVGGYLQNPNPDFAADMNLSFAMTLPLITPSASIPATLTLVSSANSASRSSILVSPTMINQASQLRRDVTVHLSFNLWPLMYDYLRNPANQAANQWKLRRCGAT